MMLLAATLAIVVPLLFAPKFLQIMRGDIQ